MCPGIAVRSLPMEPTQRHTGRRAPAARSTPSADSSVAPVVSTSSTRNGAALQDHAVRGANAPGGCAGAPSPPSRACARRRTRARAAGRAWRPERPRRAIRPARLGTFGCVCAAAPRAAAPRARSGRRQLLRRQGVRRACRPARGRARALAVLGACDLARSSSRNCHGACMAKPGDASTASRRRRGRGERAHSGVASRGMRAEQRSPSESAHSGGTRAATGTTLGQQGSGPAWERAEDGGDGGGGERCGSARGRRRRPPAVDRDSSPSQSVSARLAQ